MSSLKHSSYEQDSSDTGDPGAKKQLACVDHDGQQQAATNAVSPRDDLRLAAFLCAMPDSTDIVMEGLHKVFQHYYRPDGDGLPLLEPDLNNTIYMPSPALEETNYRLFWFKEYELMLKRISRCRTIRSYHPLVILGTPGIGKTRFLDVLLAYELAHGRPAVYVTNGRYFVFTHQGVHNVPLGFSFGKFYRGVFAFVDCEASPSLVHPGTDLAMSKLRVIQAASPRRDNTRWVTKLPSRTFVMDPPSIDELVRTMRLYDYPNAPESVIRRIIIDLGYNMRTLLALMATCDTVDAEEVSDAVEAHMIHRISTAAHVPTETLTRLLDPNFRMGSDVLHSIVTTVRNRSYNAVAAYPLYDDLPLHVLTSRYVWCHIVVTHLLHNRNRFREFYDNFSSFPHAPSFAGSLFEAFSHSYLLSSPGKLTFYQMAQVGSTMTRSNSCSVINVTSDMHLVHFSQRTATGATMDVDSYYIPRESNNPAFDAFFRHDDTFLALQMTVAVTHSIETKGLALLKKRMGLKQASDAWFVFVIPQGQRFSCVAPSSYWCSRFTFYVLEVPVDDYPLFTSDSAIDDGRCTSYGQDAVEQPEDMLDEFEDETTSTG